jgi:hypothetical protein
MEEKNILFTLVDQYGNSLKDFKFEGRFTFLYNYPNTKPKPVADGRLDFGIAYGDLPKPDKGLESTQLIIDFKSEFYNAPGRLLFKGQYQAPQNIAVTKKTLDPKEKNAIVYMATVKLSQAIQERVGSNETPVEVPKDKL